MTRAKKLQKTAIRLFFWGIFIVAYAFYMDLLAFEIPSRTGNVALTFMMWAMTIVVMLGGLAIKDQIEKQESPHQFVGDMFPKDTIKIVVIITLFVTVMFASLSYNHGLISIPFG